MKKPRTEVTAVVNYFRARDWVLHKYPELKEESILLWSAEVNSGICYGGSVSHIFWAEESDPYFNFAQKLIEEFPDVNEFEANW